MSRRRGILVVAAALAGFWSGHAAAVLQPPPGPIAAPSGYPLWFQDGNLLKIELCPAADPMCLSAPVDPLIPDSVTLGVGPETFWWTADATVTVPGDCGAKPCDVSLLHHLEAAFATGDPAIGQQTAFGRTRIFGDVPSPGLYRFTTPYGVRDVQVDVVDPGIALPRNQSLPNQGGDIGCVAPPCGTFAAVLPSEVGPFLYWDTGIPVPVVGLPHLGDGVTARPIFGSPTGNNFFRVERVDPAGPVFLAETNQFIISGRVFLGDGNSPPTLVNDVNDLATGKPLALLANPAGTPANALVGKVIDVLANDTPVDVAINPTTLAPTASVNSTVATVRALDKVKAVYTPNAGFFGTDTFTYNATTFAGLTALAPATVTVIVEDLKVDVAEFIPRLMKWRIDGTSSSTAVGAGPNIVSIHLGSATDPVTGLPTGPVLGTAQVNATTGAWIFDGKSTLSPGAAPRTISIVSGNSVARNGVPCNVR